MGTSGGAKATSSSGTLFKVFLTVLALAGSVWAVLAIDGRAEDPGKTDPEPQPVATGTTDPMAEPPGPPPVPMEEVPDLAEPPAGETVLYPAAPAEVLAELELPDHPLSESLPGDAVHEVLLTSESKLWFGGAEVGPGVLPGRFARLAGPGADPAVLIAADRAVPWKSVVDVLRACAAAGRARVFVRCAGETDRALPFPIPNFADIAVEPLGIEVRSRDGVTEIDIHHRRMAIGPLERKLPHLVEDLRGIREEGGLDAVSIQAWQDLPFADVLSVAAAAREAGYSHVLTSRVGNASYDPTNPMGSAGARSRLPAAPVVPEKEVLDVLTRSFRKWVRVNGAQVLRAAPKEVRDLIKLPTVECDDEREGLESLLEVAVTKDREVYVAGEMVDWEELKMLLFAYADRNRDQSHPSQPSKLAVILVVDRDAVWRDVQWAMQSCADPAVRVWRIYLTARNAEDEEIAIKAFLPTERSVTDPISKPDLEVKIKRRYGEGESRIEVLGREASAGDQGFAVLTRMVGEFLDFRKERGVTKPPTAELHGWAAVPFGEVVRMIAVLRGLGIANLTFVGAPPPR